MRATRGKIQATAGALLVGSVGLFGITSNSATALNAAAAAPETVVTKAKLEPLNNAPAGGTAEVVVDGRRLQVSVDAKRLLKKMPHAQHIHFGKQARNECPTVRDDDNADHRLNTAEGQPAYGPVRVSLTTKGDTSPKSTLAVNRFPKAKDREIHYDRDMRTGREVARGIRNGNAVIVIHGIDYNGNGVYDFGAGRSELDPSLPAEATDPVTCGVLKVVPAEPAPEEENPIPVP